MIGTHRHVVDDVIVDRSVYTAGEHAHDFAVDVADVRLVGQQHDFDVFPGHQRDHALALELFCRSAPPMVDFSRFGEAIKFAAAVEAGRRLGIYRIKAMFQRADLAQVYAPAPISSRSGRAPSVCLRGQ